MLKSQYPNENVQGDQTKVKIAGIALIIIGALNVLMAIIILNLSASKIRGINEQDAQNVIRIGGMIILFSGALYVILGFGTLANHSGCVLAGAILSCLGVIGSLSPFNMFGFVVNSILAVLLFQVYGSLHSVDKRISEPVQQNPLTAYYHALIPILVRVMEADGHTDRRELKKIANICSDMNISNYERDSLIRRARTSQLPLEKLVSDYFATAEKIGKSSPSNLLMATLAVAEADGIFVEEEAKLIKEIGRFAGMPQNRIDTLIQQQQSKMQEITSDSVYALLNEQRGASKEKLEASYQKLMDEFKEENFEHIGPKLASYVKQRRDVIEKAYQKLNLN